MVVGPTSHLAGRALDWYFLDTASQFCLLDKYSKLLKEPKSSSLVLGGNDHASSEVDFYSGVGSFRSSEVWPFCLAKKESLNCLQRKHLPRERSRHGMAMASEQVCMGKH